MKKLTELQRFDDTRTSAARGLQIWMVLIGKAENRQTMQYGHLAKMLHFKGSGVFAAQLGHILAYCEEHGLPPLTSLVVKKHKGTPGDGIPGHKDLQAEREKVFAFDWYGLYPPPVAQLKLAYQRHYS
jgi:hypothetical protein